MGLTEAKGALVTDVPEGPAKEAGMQSGDVIVTFDSAPVADTRDLVRRVADAPIGEAVRVIVMREGKTRTLSVTLGRREEAENEGPEAPGATEPTEPSTADLLGLTVAPLTAEQAGELGLPGGTEGLAVTDVDPASEAYSKGLREGDVITEAGQQKVVSIKDLQDRVTEAREAGRKSLLLLIRRGGDPRFVALTVSE